MPTEDPVKCIVKRELSIVDDILDAIKIVKAGRDRISFIAESSHNGTNTHCCSMIHKAKQEALDTLTDTHEHLCRLLTTMLYAPLNKKMFAPFPQLIVSASEKEASLREQMGC